MRIGGHLAEPASAILLGAAIAGAAVGCGDERPETAEAPSDEPGLPSLDVGYLGRGPYARMHGPLEKTILWIDVLDAEVRFDETMARRLEELTAGREYSEALADSIARAVTDARDVFIRVGFERGVDVPKFLERLRTSLNSALAAGMLSQAHHRSVSENIGAWFQFLAQRGMEEGDRLVYRIRNDTVRTIFQTRTGDNLLDQTDPTGAERRASVLAGYFAPASELREPLIRSLFESEDRAVGGGEATGAAKGRRGPRARRPLLG